MFSLSTGAWAFGESNFSGLLVKNPALLYLLYLLAFIGLFTLVIPVLHFAMEVVNFKNPRLIRYICMFQTVLCLLTFVLQLVGIVPLSKSMYLFHILTPATLCILAGATIYEMVRYKNLGAMHFAAPIIVLALFSLLELFNYQVRFTNQLASLFQIGILFFISFMGVTTSLYVRDLIKAQRQQEQLALEMRFTKLQLKEQEKYSSLMIDREERIKQQHHDLRHHLTVIKGLNDARNKELGKYLDDLIENIPIAQQHYCENRTVNYVISYYDTLCKRYDISFETQLTVPQEKEHISDSDLCIIFGNLLENAIDACKAISEDNKFIEIKSTLHHGLLTITMDNRFDGNLTVIDGRIRSSKRNDFGIGLSSIQSIAKAHHGDAEFKADGNIFLSSVYFSV